MELMNIARVRWACRRGMLELDVLFQPFVETQYEAMTDNDKNTFIRLLECEDPELFAWFMGHEQCPDPLFANMIVKVRGRAAP
ncbi:MULTISPECIES: FAD assembly factor SdhE [Shewanella]|uniref:FAD assembly factor SdhE n=1 Tax=Shewanella TaxID=22 RepID=UPI0002F0F574|nr:MULTISPECIES: succinate dehydrogenase assembly factor 2 [Shewanella]MBB1383915.1 succinate dehydrogenase assembly factor 2 [Shewanella sp. SR41-2]MBB1426805.1 succinate dehydrogenase assembly factor 2 [Shewanella sp. SG44-2]RPA38432.1 succinate dehydrogenase assembly factor 2 family protein [Shewanella frigidimarina]RPA63937.1 succinate dehydrogenase assembly factor 2 family protein [Shewanella frigidimarina]HBF47563.1 succinate dehydrogenase assembly factor 2 family protein [Shewanella fri